MARVAYARLAAALALALAGITCGSSNSSGTGGSSTSTTTPTSPTAPGPPASGPSCRTYPTTATVTTVTSGTNIVFNAALTGAFDTGSKMSTVNTNFAGGAPCSTVVTSYSSVADFVDEVSVIPPVFHSTTSVSTNSGACGAGTATQTYTYDSQRRLTQLSGPGSVTTYTAWDGSGRPTTGSTGGQTISITYDDANRSWTTTTTASNGSKSVGTLTFDANGNQIRNVVVSGNVTTTTTFNNTATATVCK